MCRCYVFESSLSQNHGNCLHPRSADKENQKNAYYLLKWYNKNRMKYS